MNNDMDEKTESVTEQKTVQNLYVIYAKKALKNATFTKMSTSQLGQMIHAFDLPKFFKLPFQLSYQQVLRDYSAADVNLVAQTIRDIGVVQPIVVSKDGVIIDGMLRTTALMFAPPDTQVPVEVLDISCKDSAQNAMTCILLAYFTTLRKDRYVLPSLDEAAAKIAKEYMFAKPIKPTKAALQTSLFGFDEMADLIVKRLGISRDELMVEYQKLMSHAKGRRIQSVKLLTIAALVILIRQCRDSRTFRKELYRITGYAPRASTLIQFAPAIGHRITPNCEAMARTVLANSPVKVEVDADKIKDIKDVYSLATMLKCAGVPRTILRAYLGTYGRGKCI